MARTALTQTDATTSFPTAGTDLTWNTGDASNNNDFGFGGNELVLVQNTHASAAKTVTLVSIADDQGRTGDITAESIPAGVTRMFGPFRDKTGWRQSGNRFYINPQTTDVKIAVIRLPGA